MALRFSLAVPNGALNELNRFTDPVDAYESMTRVVQTVEELGFAAVWIPDVLLSESNLLFESWTTTAALARDTKRIRIGQAVTYSGLRNPALLAKMASTVDIMSHGRLTVGIGSGSPMLASAFQSYGYDFPDVPTRTRQMREAIKILLAMWSEEEATFEGKYYQVHGAINQPKGVQKPHIPLLIGGNGEQATLKLVAQYADACNVFGTPSELEHKFAVLKEHCAAVGRDYESIYRTAGSYCALADTDEQALAKVPEAARTLFSRTGLIGCPTTIRQRIAEFEAVGTQELMLRFPDSTDLNALRRFAQEFIAG
ncbi:TIGR03560 family F420-dependent LLM class oxidoreductase [Ktedonosporobacter rubrisoli]|uniref:TIGR03560 family F420-dependent LLM class oxidoreductase n=1 Tax=Ktedonosporobacter rubrisoli TaxID=2509675 RepID=A0A4P6JX21_KTERU|nr:TIGR03560 family F420-dependent LLM class oxidoreductase [Ktedonosporobacter rubrisoli]QBD80288.1 TIGR03560 family F420-dependent LLM class oxidoreductase [Ktedonosporobacter rubrisoli]